MNYSKISVRYAKALFLLAEEKNILDSVKEDMVSIASIYKEVPQFGELLHDPVVNTSQKQKVVDDIFKGKISDISLSFINLVLKNNRENFIGDIARYFEVLYKKEKGIKTVVLTTTDKIDDNSKNQIIDFVKKQYNSEIELKENIDSDIIGGFILRVEDDQYDASVSSKLKNLKKTLIETAFESKIS